MTVTRSKKIQQMIDRINNKYEQLVLNVDEILNIRHNFVKNHETFNNELNRINDLLKNFQNNFNENQSQEYSLRNNNLEHLNNQLRNLENDVNNLEVIGEKLLLETNANGREIIRNLLNDKREMIVNFKNRFQDEKKTIDAYFLKLNNYQEIFKQSYNFLKNIEENFSKNCLNNCTNLNDIKSQTNKLKALYRDLECHQNIIDNLIDNNDMNFDGDDIKNLYENVKKSINETLDDLKNSTDFCEKFHELHKECQDSQKCVREKLLNSIDLFVDKNNAADLLNDLNQLKDDNCENLHKIEQLLQLRNLAEQKNGNYFL